MVPVWTETPPTPPALLDDQHRLAKLGRLDRARGGRRAAANYNKIVWVHRIVPNDRGENYMPQIRHLDIAVYSVTGQCYRLSNVEADIPTTPDSYLKVRARAGGDACDSRVSDFTGGADP